MKLVSLGCAWILGIYLGSLSLSPLWLVLLSLCPIPLLALLAWRGRTAALWGGLCLIVLLGGIGWYQWRATESTLEVFNNRGVVTVRGEVVRDPEVDDGLARITLAAERVWADDRWTGVSGKVLIKTAALPACSLGQRLEVRGELTSLSGIEDVEYAVHLDRQGFCSLLTRPEEVVSLGQGWLFEVRQRLAQSLASALSEPQASLAGALLLGIRSHIPQSLQNGFYQTGTAHLLAISGFNVAIFGGMLLVGGAWALGRRRPTYLFLALAGVWLYASLTGMQPPVLRAAIMFSTYLASLWLGRPGTALPSLALAAAVMAGVNPAVLWDVSFQLSFAAVAGLILFFPVFQRWGARITSGGSHAGAAVVRTVIDGTALGLAAIGATLPLTLYYFGDLSLFALPATVVVSLFLPGALLLAAATAVLGLFAPAVAAVVGWAAWLFLTCIIEVVGAFGSVEAASLPIGPVHWAFIWVYYALVGGLVLRRQLGIAISGLSGYARRCASWLAGSSWLNSRLAVRLSLAVLVVCTALVWIAVLAMPDERLRVSFLDTGQGDAVLIETPAGQQILIDGGPDGDRVCQELGEKLPFWDRSLDLVVLSHGHDDHITGLVEVLHRYRVDLVLESGLAESTPAYEAWLEAIEERSIERAVAEAGQRIDLGGGITIDVIHPQEEMLQGTDSDANNNSLVLRLVLGGVSFLFTGDIDREAETAILGADQWQELNCTVLKVPHHGSAGSTSARLLSAVEPEIAVVSVGEDNGFGHPDGATVARLGEAEIYRTDMNGTVSFITDGERLWVETER
ncbi:MAG: DNA internalization-related competence protein ComEC/Rec2 [Chloroflexi bacterium]|nr:DNA internalization-related competence protein ComEC/Rec2 [Chloroflexota bacterium]